MCTSPCGCGQGCYNSTRHDQHQHDTYTTIPSSLTGCCPVANASVHHTARGAPRRVLTARCLSRSHPPPSTTAISLPATATPAALLPAATQRQAAQRRASSPLGVLEPPYGARSRAGPRRPLGRCAVGGLLCTTDRRCTAPPCASRGGRAARERAASRSICSACHGARARGWAHWSIGTWSAAARAGGRTRVWAVRSGRAREPRAPGRSTHTQAPLQTAQPPHRAAFVTRRACGAGPALRRNEVVDRSHGRPSQPHASTR